MDKTTESFVRTSLSPRARRIFTKATFRSSGCDSFRQYIPVPVAHIRTEFWELGFIPRKDIFGFETRGVFVYSVASDSLFGPFWCFFQNGRWELYLANE